MSSDEITQIKIGNGRVGIIGLKLVLAEVAEAAGTHTDEGIRTELLKRLNKRNYIPEPSKVEYGKAFLRAAPLAKKTASLIGKETFNYRAKTLRR